MKKKHNNPTLDQSVSIGVPEEGGEWPSHEFWELFNDQQLTHFVEKALGNNPSLQAAQERVIQVKQEAYRVRAKMFPRLDQSLDVDWLHLSKDSLLRFPPSFLPSVIHQTSLALHFNYEFDFWGKNLNSFRAALGMAYAQMAEEHEASLMLSVAMCNAYFDWQANHTYLSLWEKIVDEKRAYLHLVKLRAFNALSNQIDVDDAEGALLSASQNVVQVNEEISLAKNKIKILMGLGPGEDLAFTPPCASYDDKLSIPDNLPIDLLSRRPDIIATLWKASSASNEIRVAKTAFYPSVDLTSFVGLRSLQWSDLFKADSYMASLRPAFRLPIFTAGKLTANLRSKEAAYNAAVYDYNSTILLAAKQVADRTTELNALSENLDLQAQNVDRYKSSYELQKLRYTTGLGNYLSCLEREGKLLEERLMEEGLYYGRLNMTLALIKALGGGYYCGCE